MTPKLVRAEYLSDYKIQVKFEDDKVGVIDLEHELWGEIFEPLRDIRVFRNFKVDTQLDTITWSTGADLAPEYLYDRAVTDECRIATMAPRPHDRAFFPVSKVRLSEFGTSHTFTGDWAIVSNDPEEIISIVTADYELVSNVRACELGRRAFELLFGSELATRLRIFNVIMPATRSWAYVDLISDDFSFAIIGEDRWLPFLRVSNSYNRSRALGFTVGVYRQTCTNGMIFDEQPLKLKVTNTASKDLERRLVGAFEHRHFDIERCKGHLTNLMRLSVPTDRFVAGMLEILDVRVPAAIPRHAARRKGWPELGPCFSELGRKYGAELGNTAYALANAASEYASSQQAPLMSPARVNAHQTRCGTWVDRILKQYEPSLTSETMVDMKPGSMNAAKRLMDWARASPGSCFSDGQKKAGSEAPDRDMNRAVESSRRRHSWWRRTTT